MENNKVENSVGFQFGAFMRTFRKLIEKRFQENKMGLSPEQFNLLFKISEATNPTQTEIAQSTGMDKSAVMRVIDALEDKRFVARFGDGDDRRRKILVLTADGLAKVKQTEQIFESIISEISADVKEEELKGFLRVLGKLRNNAENMIQ
jgi:DNA-binding MarR family transcriptional regulator